MGRALLNLHEFLKAYKLSRCKDGDLKTGDVVACFTKKTVCCLGKVLHAGYQELVQDHEDGPFGEVFVLPYFKAKCKTGVPYNAQSGWWMYKEVCLLPRQGECFSPGEAAKAVMYVGHKPTTRREQIQQNWLIEIDDVELDEVEILQGSPRRSPRKGKSKGKSKSGGRRQKLYWASGSMRPVQTSLQAAKAKKLQAAKAKNKPKAKNKDDDETAKDDDGTPEKPESAEAAKSAEDAEAAKSAEAAEGAKAASKSAKKKLNYSNHEFDTPDLAPQKKMRKSRFARDIIHLALAGDLDPLKGYIQTFDFEERGFAKKKLSQAEWETLLPAWTTKEKSRGLKAWRSKTARGEWNIKGVCAKIINKAVSIYMEIFGHPPVYEGVRGKGSTFSIKEGGLDMYKPFILTVHRAYCQNLNPEVEVGMVAYDKVLQYMNTRPVRLKLLRAVRSVS